MPFTNSEPTKIVTVEEGKVYVARAESEVPLKIKMLMLYFQVAITFSVMGISGYIIVDNNNPNKTTAWTVLSTLIGFWMPSPASQK